MLPIKGVQKTTLIDYPGKVASTIFIAGCNFKCPYCHNMVLVKDTEQLPTIPEDEIFNFLSERQEFIDGVCITGGEPTLYQELPDFIKKIKALGLKVKLDTNGTNPEMLQKLIDSKLLDYIAMDLKGYPDNYALVVSAPVDLSKIEQSVELVKKGAVKYEFRTTILPRFFKLEDVDKIGPWLEGAESFYIQQFEKHGGTLDPHLEKESIYSKPELEAIA
ncbi:MAG: anaerobic ribonucleoside-triphosphate reductase activating protein, partial [Candidatus Margulisbacteria bacterium]|nr:anaerobic ribonucleoside-triphosphate reductase activating protein [Candidatus Margulisiibacteriota bacterium]